ncbi:DNA-directed RNA polymerase subunit beta [bacterium]|nr:DNA-directed RNA polymerase subunit beta [bacterium]
MDLKDIVSKVRTAGTSLLEQIDLLEVPRKSYQNFLESGLRELFQTFFPVRDYTGMMVLEFVDYRIGEPLHTEEECRAQSLTYEAPLYVRFRLINYTYGEEITEDEINLCDIPLMTKRGTFIINGSEKVVVNQLTRAPGIYFDTTMGVKKGGAVSYKGELIPAEGSWIRFRTEGRWVETTEESSSFKIEEAIYVTIGKGKNFPITLLIRALNSEYLPIQKEVLVGRIANETVVDRDTGEIIIRKGERIDEEAASRLEEVRGRSNWNGPVPIEPRIALERMDVIKVVAPPGPSSTTQDLIKLFGEEQVLEYPEASQLLGKWLGEDVKGENGEVIATAFTKIEKKELARKIEKLNLERLLVYDVPKKIEETLKEEISKGITSEDAALKAFYKTMRTGEERHMDVKGAEQLLAGYLGDIRHYDLGVVGRKRINEKLGISVPEHVRWLTKSDFVAIAKYMVKLATGDEDSRFEPDDIDHIKNKRVRPVGELLQLFLRPYFLQLERAIKERMASIPRDKGGITPDKLIYARPLEGAIKAFFATGQLTQFMDQTNPLSELTHKRRLSVLGPGGLTRRSVSWEVRNIHPSHYGKICPIETPEGPNVGLITSLTSYALINEDGFLITPYMRLENGRLTGEIVYLTPEEEEKYYIVPADAKVDENGMLKEKYILTRYGSKFPLVEREKAQFMEVAPEQVFSLSASLIPFLEHDDADRALMGANYQRQAVPLLIPQAPIIKTGMEGKVAVSSQTVVVADAPGIVEKVDARRIVVRRLDGGEDVYPLINFRRSNSGTCIHQRPIVEKGDRVREGQILADSLSSDKGEIALGANLLIAYMPWEGYNYEDAIVISDRIVKEDVLTSIHIEEYETTTRNTNLGPEEITRDIPGVGEDALKDLDENGIIRIGARVGPHDILVGKIAPKPQRELSPEEKLVAAIFGKKGEDVKDVSLRMPHGERGIVVDVKVFSRFKYFCPRCGNKEWFSKEPSSQELSCKVCGAEIVKEEEDTLQAGVNAMVKVYVAQIRPIMVGDKLSGRHGNKGVIAKILPVEDMPHLPDGTPVDIVLNPLGVPSRMNVGQLYEIHLGWVGKNEGISYVCRIFQGPKEEDIKRHLKRVTDGMRKEKLVQILEEIAPNIIDELSQKDTFEESLQELGNLLKRLPEGEVLKLANEIGLATTDDKEICERLREMVNNRIGFDEETGKCTLIDGRTGEPFNQKVAVGYGYIMKLEHLAEDKMHARSIGTYSLITQQPLGGKAQFGGQRFGEMEVWALEAYGAAHTLQEMLTIKSDDTQGRSEAYTRIVRGEVLEMGGIPESFNILVNELRSLGLNVIIESEEESEEGEERNNA